MKSFTEWTTTIGLDQWGYPALIGLGLILLVSLIIGIHRILKTKAHAGWFTGVSFVIALGINAEAMYLVATEKLRMPVLLAVGVFAVFEIFQLNSMRLASKHYRDHKHPGMHAWVVWGVAAVSGLITLSNSKSLTEALVRLLLPLAVAGIWHVSLIADGVVKVKRKGVFAYSPRRLLELRGVIVSDDSIELDELARKRKIRKMVTLGNRLQNRTGWGWWDKRRFVKLALTADESVVAAVVDQLSTAHRAVTMMLPTDGATGRASSQLGHQLGQSQLAVGGNQSASQSDQLPSVDQSVGDQLSVASRTSSQLQLGSQSADQSKEPVDDPDAVLVALLRQHAAESDGPMKIAQARDILTLDPSKGKCGPDKAKRLMRLAGLYEG